MALGSESWSTGTVRGESHASEWLPIDLDVGFSVGILKDKSWVVETADGIAKLADHRSSIFILQLLEMPYVTMLNRLELEYERLSKAGIDYEVFPIDNLVLAGLRQGSYWVGLTLNWLEEHSVDDCLKKELVAALRGVVSDKKLQQRVRQKANRILAIFGGQ